MEHMTAQQVATWVAETADAPIKPLLLDVREPWEFETAQIAGTTLLPMSTITGRIAEVEALRETADGAIRPIVCICHHGARSMQVAGFLEKQGLEQIFNLTGGIHAWSLQVDPAVPTY
jgi:rhodanese-related sulfurtransferase